MYRSGKEYEKLDKLAIEIYLDYNFKTFPLDLEEVCRRMGVSLIPYSQFNKTDQSLLRKKSKYGFHNPLTRNSSPIIFYNDDLNELHSNGCIRLSIAHEIKHYANEDVEEDPVDDDLADHFGRYFLSPTPHLIVNNIINPHDIVFQFGVSYTTARNITSNIINRTKVYGSKIFNYELPLIRQLDPIYYKKFLSRKDGDAL